MKLHNKEIYSFIQKFLLKVTHKRNRRNWKIAARDDKKKRYIRKYVNKHICRFKRSLIMHKRLSTLQNLLRSAHRFGSCYLTQTFFYDFWMRYILWGVLATAKENKILRVYVPYTARLKQRIAYKYFSISRWNNRSFS
jgi:hypothetical protein